MVVDSDACLLIDWTIVTSSFPRRDFTDNRLKVQAETCMETLKVILVYNQIDTQYLL